ncbi:hypothetical protein DV515_00007146 [Chloebia gouldiae]|uniref:C3H1-type domain-containing protein n=1 Tax=Chloebia gouldiae TaxID=44316 RepID=A0A3L8SIG3_CHLGU|nr:hypothetical protein DV515_00007146 [Chloebia gouldiae]
MAVNVSLVRDTKWLTLEVCREFQRGTCSRSDAECKFAHPSRSCHVENGRVIACFDSLKVRTVTHLLSLNNAFIQELLITQQTMVSPHWEEEDEVLGPDSKRLALPAVSQKLAKGAQKEGGGGTQAGCRQEGAWEASKASRLQQPRTEQLKYSRTFKYNKQLGMKILRESRTAMTSLCCPGETQRNIAVFSNVQTSLTAALSFPNCQGRCTRENCKYLHPPPHLKTQLEINGRNNLIQQKTAAAMFAQQMQFMLPGAQLQPIDYLDSFESPMSLKTAQTLTQPFVPFWGSRILLPLLGADGGVKAEDEQLTWPVMLGASAGANFNSHNKYRAPWCQLTKAQFSECFAHSSLKTQLL